MLPILTTTPRQPQFASQDPKFDDFLVYAIDFVDLQLKMKMIKEGHPQGKDLVAAEVEQAIEANFS